MASDEFIDITFLPLMRDSEIERYLTIKKVSRELGFMYLDYLGVLIIYEERLQYLLEQGEQEQFEKEREKLIELSELGSYFNEIFRDSLSH